MRYKPVRIAAIDRENSLVDSSDPTRCTVTLILTLPASVEWRGLFERAFKLPVEWSEDHTKLTFRTERAVAGHWVGEAVKTARSTDGTVEAGHRPFIDAQKELDKWLEAASKEHGIDYGDTSAGGTFEYSM